VISRRCHRPAEGLIAVTVMQVAVLINQLQITGRVALPPGRQGSPELARSWPSAGATLSGQAPEVVKTAEPTQPQPVRIAVGSHDHLAGGEFHHGFGFGGRQWPIADPRHALATPTWPARTTVAKHGATGDPHLAARAQAPAG